jgi:amino acid transporter
MSNSTAPSPNATRRKAGLSTWKIVFFVIAATTPMAAMVGTVPFGFALGTGAGMPAMYVLAGLTMLCFICGYAAMSRNIVNTGALYTYIRAGLGRLPGAGAAYLAILSYVAFTIGAIGAFGYFAQMILPFPGISWQWYSAALLALVALLGRRQVDLSVKTIGLLMSAEILILVILDFAIGAAKGAHALPAASFSPPVAFGAGLAAAATFAFTSYIGIESAPLYSEEARDPRRSIPRAGYWAVGMITVFYTFTSWLAVGGLGVGHVRSAAATEGGGLFFALNAQYTTLWLTDVMKVLLVTSFLATTVALHNAASRYIYALGREGLLPRRLGERHPRHGSPARASALLSLISVVVVGAYAVARLNPYTSLAISMISLATIGIMILLLGASVSVIVYFARRPSGRHWWRTAAAPALALAGLGVAVVLVLGHYRYLTGTDSVVINSLPWLIPVGIAAGVARVAWLRAKRPEAYAAMHPEFDTPGSDHEPGITVQAAALEPGAA